MSISRSHYVALGRAASAAKSWANYEQSSEDIGDTSYRDALEDLMLASRSLYRVSLPTDPPRGPEKMRSLLQEPVEDWLGAGESRPLLRRFGGRMETTGYADQILEETGASPKFEEAQRRVGEVQQELRRRYEETGSSSVEELYRQFRKELIEKPFTTFDRAIDFTSEVSVGVADLFTDPPEGQKIMVGGREGVFLCPICAYPMKIQHEANRVTCGASRCQRKGAQFTWDGSSASPVSPTRKETAEFVPTEEKRYCQVRHGIWLSTVLPGLVELRLNEKLQKIASTRLWPEVDRYDLHVEVGRPSESPSDSNEEWRVDVKDYRLGHRLRNHLSESRTPTDQIWVVVPDDRSEQVPFLRRSNLSRMYRFETASGLVSRVRDEA